MNPHMKKNSNKFKKLDKEKARSQESLEVTVSCPEVKLMSSNFSKGVGNKFKIVYSSFNHYRKLLNRKVLRD